MKRLAALLMTLVLLLTALGAFAEGDSYDPIALTVDDHVMTQSELYEAARLYMFEAALSCAGYGYDFDMVDRLNIEDEMDKLLFDVELEWVERDQAESMGLYPLSAEAMAAAQQDADELWNEYWDIAMSDFGMAFLPAGNYQFVDGDDEGNLIRYFESFGLTKEAMLEEYVRYWTGEELKKAVTADMTDKSNDEIINYYSTWILGRMDTANIEENKVVIELVMDELGADSYDYEGEGDDGEGYGYESFERSLLIGDHYYTLGDNTVRDLENNGWAWTQDVDGKFAFRVTEDGNYFYARTDNRQPDGKLVMLDMFHAYDISYEYLGFGFDLAFNPEDQDFLEYMMEIYGGDFNDEGIYQARTEVNGGTLLIEWSEGVLRLTLE